MRNELKNFFNQTQREKNSVLSKQNQEKVKTNIFANLGTQISQDPAESILEKLKRLFLKTYVVAPLACLLLVVGTTSVSAQAQPGDKLYPVKRRVEKIQVYIAPTEDTKLNLQINFAERRLQEHKKLNNSVNDIEIEAKEALNFVKTAEQKYRTKGQEQKAKDIEERFKKYREELEDSEDLEDIEDGRVRGINTRSDIKTRDGQREYRSLENSIQNGSDNYPIDIPVEIENIENEENRNDD